MFLESVARSFMKLRVSCYFCFYYFYFWHFLHSLTNYKDHSMNCKFLLLFSLLVFDDVINSLIIIILSDKNVLCIKWCKSCWSQWCTSFMTQVRRHHQLRWLRTYPSYETIQIFWALIIRERTTILYFRVAMNLDLI